MSEGDYWTPLAKSYHPLKCGSIDGTDQAAHDHAIIRAMNSKYKPNKDVIGEPNTTIFVARLNPETDEETLLKTFSRFGEIERLRLVRDIVTGHSKCYAFIEYCEEKSAVKAERQSEHLTLDGSEVLVDFEFERNMPGWIPRRFGGGFGGKKESGQLRFGGKDRPFRKPINVGEKQLNRNIELSSRPGDRANFFDSGRGRGPDRDRFSGLDRDRFSGPDRDRYSRENRETERDRDRYTSRDESRSFENRRDYSGDVRRDRYRPEHRESDRVRKRDFDSPRRSRSRDRSDRRDSRSRHSKRKRSRSPSRERNTGTTKSSVKYSGDS